MFGLVTATAITDGETREDMVRFCAQWVCLPFVLMLIGLIWYANILPEELRNAMQRRTADIRPFIRSFLDSAPLLFLAGMFLFMRMPQKAYRPYVIMVLLLGFAVAGSFEWIRETARRPWLVYGYMYSNGITVADGQKMNEQGVFATSGWARLRALGPKASDARLPGQTAPAREVQAEAGPAAAPALAGLTPEERGRFGRFLFTQQCSSCHGLGAPMLDIVPRVKGRGEMGVSALLAAQGVISPYMPPFFGTEEERLLLARWLAELGKR